MPLAHLPDRLQGLPRKQTEVARVLGEVAMHEALHEAVEEPGGAALEGPLAGP